MSRIVAGVRRHPDIWLALAAAVTSITVALLAIRAWRLELGIPIRIGGDDTQVLGWVQNLIESGSPTAGPRLNAPFGQQFTDWPFGSDLLNVAVLRTITLFTDNAVTAVTVFYLLAFPLIAVAAYGALRGLGISRPVAYLAAVVYSILPYHFGRATTHLFLAAYYAVPVACYLLVRTIQGKALFGLDAAKGSDKRPWRKVLVSVGLATLVALTGIYYAAFTLLLLIPAAALGWVKSRSAHVVGSAALIGGIIVVVVLVASLPMFLASVQNGPNVDYPGRSAAETGRHQIRLLTMLMPVPGHFLSPLAALAARYANAFPRTGENGESAGLVAVLGLVLLGVVVLGSLIGALGHRSVWRKERAVAALVIVSFLIAMEGGLSGVFAILVSPQISSVGQDVDLH